MRLCNGTGRQFGYAVNKKDNFENAVFIGKIRLKTTIRQMCCERRDEVVTRLVYIVFDQKTREFKWSAPEIDYFAFLDKEVEVSFRGKCRLTAMPFSEGKILDISENVYNDIDTSDIIVYLELKNGLVVTSKLTNLIPEIEGKDTFGPIIYLSNDTCGDLMHAEVYRHGFVDFTDNAEVVVDLTCGDNKMRVKTRYCDLYKAISKTKEVSTGKIDITMAQMNILCGAIQDKWYKLKVFMSDHTRKLIRALGDDKSSSEQFEVREFLEHPYFIFYRVPKSMLYEDTIAELADYTIDDSEYIYIPSVKNGTGITTA